MTFEDAFLALTGNRPYPWQANLFRAFQDGLTIDSLDIPTGLGKTAVIPIWLIARALVPGSVPCRLVYVVDRRAVVDQATAEAERIAEKLANSTDKFIVSLRDRLALGKAGLTISTLRGQFADNRRWLDDPSSPAIVVGTVDMIGSRLLFSGYGVSRRMRPVHAGLLGTDSLIVLDEAHLVAPFEAMIRSVADPKGVRGSGFSLPVRPLRVLALTATGKGTFGRKLALSVDDRAEPRIAALLRAPKPITFVDPIGKLEDQLSDLAWSLARAEDGSARRVLVFCSSRDIADKVAGRLRDRAAKEKSALAPKDERGVDLLVGARRVKEREELKAQPVYQWFLTGEKGIELGAGPAYLIATAAGEVGIDLDADAMVCDLVPFERMVQRLGRVNRKGNPASAPITVVKFAPVHDKEEAEEKAVARLMAPFVHSHRGNGPIDGSVGAMIAMKAEAVVDPELADSIRAATTPDPLRPELTRAVVDAWSMTSLEKHTGRPIVGPWLRGWEKDGAPQTEIVWRHFMPMPIPSPARGISSPKEIEAFFDAAPVHLTEILETEADRAVSMLEQRVKVVAKKAAVEKEYRDGGPAGALIERHTAILLDGAGEVLERWTLAGLAVTFADKRRKERFEEMLIGNRLVLDAAFGGLSADGLLDGDSDTTVQAIDSNEPHERLLWDEEDRRQIGFRIRFVSTTDRADDVSHDAWEELAKFSLGTADDDDPAYLIVEKWVGEGAAASDTRNLVRYTQGLQEHLDLAATVAEKRATKLGFGAELVRVFRIAAALHDLGKYRERWQRAMGVPRGCPILAKTTGKGRNPALMQVNGIGYRHEFGSIGDIESFLNDGRIEFSRQAAAEFAGLPPMDQDLVLFLIASHHGNARPSIAALDFIKPPSHPDAARRARDIALRTIRIQEQWGVWATAFLDAVFRSCDATASKIRDDQLSNEAKESKPPSKNWREAVGS